MPKRTRIVWEGDQFLIAEEPSSPSAPVLSLYAHEKNQTHRAVGDVTFTTEDGTWRPLGRFENGVLTPVEDAPCDPELMRRMVKRYLWERAEQAAHAGPSYHYVEVDERPVHALNPAQPGGLLLPLFELEADAEAFRIQHGGKGTLASTGALYEFFAFRAEEGFAGAIIDTNQFVFWCVDDQQHLKFLRLRPDGQGDEVIGHLLGPDGKWTLYDGESTLDFLEDQDRWDRLMQDVLGDVPYHGYDEKPAWFTLSNDDGPLLLEESASDEKETLWFAPLFAREETAARYLVERELEADISRVERLSVLVRDAQSAGAVVRLHPDAHRACAGALWLRAEDEVVLDSFSGFWTSGDGRRFSRVDLS